MNILVDEPFRIYNLSEMASNQFHIPIFICCSIEGLEFKAYISQAVRIIKREREKRFLCLVHLQRMGELTFHGI